MTPELYEEPDSHPSPSSVLFVLLIFLAGIMSNWGFFSWQGLALVLCAMGIAVWFHLYPSFHGPSTESLLTAMLIGAVIVLCTFASGQDQQKIVVSLPNVQVAKWRYTAPGMAIKLLGAIAVLVSMVYLLPFRLRWTRYGFIALVIIGVVVKVLMLSSTPRPSGDVFVCQTAAAQSLLAGKNPYTILFRSPYVEGEWFGQFPYPPLVIWCNFVSWFAFKDIRVMWIFCDLLGAFFLYRLARLMNPAPEQQPFAELLTGVFLFFPRTLFVLEQSFTEPLIVATLGAFALTLAGKRSTLVRGCQLGLWLSSKQYVVVAVSLAIRLRQYRHALWLYAVLTAFGIALPFICWNYDALLGDIFSFFLASPPNPEALSIYGALTRFGYGIPWGILILLWGAGIGFFTWKMKRSLSGWLFSTASLWMYFFLWGKQAFINYFYVIAYALLLSVASIPQRTVTKSSEKLLP